MLTNVKRVISRHFTSHIILYFIVLLCFSIGIASGVFSVKALSEVQKGQLLDYLVSSLKTTLSGGQINNTQVFWNSVLNNLKTALLMWAFALSVIAFPLVFAAVGVRGFVLGFTAGFLIQNLGYKGILFIVVSILPQSLINIPVLIALAVVSVNYSVSVFKSRKTSKYVKRERFKMFFGYTFVSFLLYVFLVSGSLIEAYISPIFLKGISSYIIG